MTSLTRNAVDPYICLVYYCEDNICFCAHISEDSEHLCKVGTAALNFGLEQMDGQQTGWSEASLEVVPLKNTLSLSATAIKVYHIDYLLVWTFFL